MKLRRSGCPINLTLETFGDRWSLIILRDTMFGGRRRSFRSYLTESLEGIASNILSDRLQRLTASGLLTRSADPTHKQRVVYSLTEQAIELVPLMAFMGSWGIRHAHPSVELSARAQVLEDGGPQLWTEFMDELRHIHLGSPAPLASALAKMEAAYQASVAGHACDTPRLAPATLDGSYRTNGAAP
ncbi:winged helix-turn-helix transcriptional regulator [Devosia aurantiaca]|uniref:Helix-turn-helix transcriptional regulator n=1 Tax=Devosia aurantiaca TaxID=2714858 RepID=A0A6M1STN3_9HYPH|nr:helix-turn-helix domain-containing protein [Devosia aurantiaca]NGP16301.1 helix-turn-helix transcriptional regulator [Devosia aurantiaca]